MSRSVSTYQRSESIKKIAVMAITALVSAIGLNFFLIPAKVSSTRVSGITQIIAILLYISLGIHINTGIFILFLDVPVSTLGFIKLGEQSTVLSLTNVTGIPIVIMLAPIVAVTTNPLMDAIMDDVLVGAGAGFSLKMGFNTGGMDITSLILSRTAGKAVGNSMFLLNDIIVLLAGFVFNWESMSYIIISTYYLSQVVGVIHTNHQKVTAVIATARPEAAALEVSQQIARGMTLLSSIGGYSGVEGRMIMMVITRYELYDLEQVAYNIDGNASIDILSIQSVLGRFANGDEQRIFHDTGTFPELQSYKVRRYPPKKKLR